MDLLVPINYPSDLQKIMNTCSNTDKNMYVKSTIGKVLATSSSQTTIMSP